MFGKSLRQIILFVALLGFGVHAAHGAEPASSDESKPSAEIALLHKNAERLYFQFKPKEAAAELQKILQADGRNFDALIKMARAYIDIGDGIEESGSTWKESKLKEYGVAED